MKRPDYDKAATMACRCLLACKVDALPVDPADMLRKCRNTRLLSCREAAEMLGGTAEGMERQLAEAEAWTYRYAMPNGESFHAVCYKENGHPGRLNFSLAHELGHLVLKHNGAGPWEEREADHFAMYLLFPRPAMRRLAERNQTVYAEQLAALCYTSVRAAEGLERCRRSRIDRKIEAMLDEQMKNALPAKLPECRLTALWHPVSIGHYALG